jgi:hypothetical protein
MAVLLRSIVATDERSNVRKAQVADVRYSVRVINPSTANQCRASLRQLYVAIFYLPLVAKALQA